MKDAENLMKILDALKVQWRKLSSDLKDEQLSYLKTELSELEIKLNSAQDIDEIGEISKIFIQTFSKLEPLEFMVNIEKNDLRSGDLPEADEEIRIKIINYCVILSKKIDDLKDEKRN